MTWGQHCSLCETSGVWQIRGSSGTESCTLSPFTSCLLFADISVTGKELRKWDFSSDCSRILFGKRSVCSVHTQHGGSRVFNLIANGLDSWKIALSSLYGACLGSAGWKHRIPSDSCLCLGAASSQQLPCIPSPLPLSFGFCVNSIRQNRSSPPRLMHHPQFTFYYHGYPQQSK